MNKKTFRCWVPDYGDTFEDAKAVECMPFEDDEDAAEQYLDSRFSDFEYPTSLDIRVVQVSESGDRMGEETTCEVTVEYEPVFIARRKK